LVKLDSDYAYFEINGAIKRFPESGRLTGDSMSEIYFFNSTKEFRHFDHLLTLKFSGYKKSTKILDQPDLEENFADGVAEGFESETTLEKKLYILRKLQQMPLTVFGSVATKELSQANDFDVFFDLDSNPEYKKHITPIMELARNYYGWIDPFVLEDNVLYVRNDEATGWVRAKNAKEILKNVKLHGVPISQIQPDLAENFADGRVKDLRRKNKSPDNRIVAAITKAVPNAQEIWFHGSRAIGKHRPNSDIDILVVVPEELSAHDYIDTVDVLHQISKNFSNYDIQPTKPGYNIHRIAQEEGKLLWSNVKENFADGQVKGRSRPGRVRRAGASCKGSVTDLRARARKSGGEKGKMYRWCLNMKAGKKR
jgi:predicted nucleotidyltransferase